uniref:Uncharacterized protein n=1 Tax=Xiphophorus maculatus TaxID=8083 RepID=A0A3B5QS49_XIPMA
YLYKYRKIVLEETLRTSVKYLKLEQTLQHDNDTKPTSKPTKKWVRMRKLKVLRNARTPQGRGHVSNIQALRVRIRSLRNSCRKISFM